MALTRMFVSMNRRLATIIIVEIAPAQRKVFGPRCEVQLWQLQRARLARCRLATLMNEQAQPYFTGRDVVGKLHNDAPIVGDFDRQAQVAHGTSLTSGL